MNQTEKKDYKPPVLGVVYVTMEQGIASSSAQIVLVDLPIPLQLQIGMKKR